MHVESYRRIAEIQHNAVKKCVSISGKLRPKRLAFSVIYFVICNHVVIKCKI